MQIKKFRQGVVRKVGSSLSLRIETERQPDMDRVASALSLG
nr:MAG TPA: hypothetical protein [Caudoviricetes sp.]DAI78909.1 MAG TPA: hypothetical protein [Caudoviricetes sp.]